MVYIGIYGNSVVGIGIGYTLSLILIGSIREILGSGTLTIIDNLSTLFNFKLVLTIIPATTLLPNPLFISPAGAFLIVGIVLGIINFIKERKKTNV